MYVYEFKYPFTKNKQVGYVKTDFLRLQLLWQNDIKMLQAPFHLFIYLFYQ